MNKNIGGLMLTGLTMAHSSVIELQRVPDPVGPPQLTAFIETDYAYELRVHCLETDCAAVQPPSVPQLSGVEMKRCEADAFIFDAHFLSL